MEDDYTPTQKVRLAIDNALLGDYILETDKDIVTEILRISESARSVLLKYKDFKAKGYDTFITGMEALETAIVALDEVSVSVHLGNLSEPILCAANKEEKE